MKTLTQKTLIEIFGKKKQTPDECILKLATNGITFTPKLFIEALNTAALDILASNDDYVRESDYKDSMYDTFEDNATFVGRNSLIIIGNIARIIKYTTEFNNAVKSKDVIPKIKKLQNILLEKNLNKFRWCAVADMYDGLSDIIDLIQSKEY